MILCCFLGKENNAPKSKRKQPAIRGKEVNHELCKAIKKCLLVTPALACLKLQGLPLRDSDILYLAKVSSCPFFFFF